MFNNNNSSYIFATIYIPYIYRVIYNECEIVDSSESHKNNCLGLEIHLLGKFTSYILILWYHT